MKLSKQTEWIVVGVLIIYIAFFQPMPVLRDMMSTSVGKAVALAAVVYVWKYVSAIVALLLAVAVVRCMGNVWEMFSGAETTCMCEGAPEYTWDPATKKCKNKDGKEGVVKSCVCASGYAWDGGEKGTKQCVPVSGEQPPIPAPDTNPVADNLEKVAAMEAAAANAAPAVSTGPATSSAPMTTPGAAADMAASASGPAPPMSGVQPTGLTASTPATL